MIFLSFLATRALSSGATGPALGPAGAGQEVTLVRCSIEDSLMSVVWPSPLARGLRAGETCPLLRAHGLATRARNLRPIWHPSEDSWPRRIAAAFSRERN